MTFEEINEVDNHEQILNGLRYRTMAWEEGADEPFHEEVGYWLWDAEHQQVIKSFLIPRGVSVIAGGTTTADAKEFTMKAELGSATYGICSNQFLDREFRTESFEVTVTILNEKEFKYSEVTKLRIKGQNEIFLHTDENTMTKKS